MDLKEKLVAGLERAAEEAEKAFDKGRTKVAELQLEVQMDSLAKKLGYIVFDFYRGRPIDQAVRQQLLDELSVLEERLARLRTGAGGEGSPPGEEARWQAEQTQPPKDNPQSSADDPEAQGKQA